MKKSIMAVVLLGVLMASTGCERAKRSILDTKADMVGTHRKASVYAPLGGDALAVYEDRKMMVERKDTGTTLWRGSSNTKVTVSPNAIVIVEDM